MRPLTDDELKSVFSKIKFFIGDNIKLLIDRADGEYGFRLHKDRVYYSRLDLIKKAQIFPRKSVQSFGLCIGKFTKSGKFHLHVTALDIIAPYAKNKIWLKESAQMQFLYGQNPLRSGIGRLSEAIPKYDGVVVFSMNDTPLGFGVAAKSTTECRSVVDPLTVVCFNQADVGQYIRNESELQ
ncbi:hypothetical protein ACOME3_007019 [Neoechinorhynchus agilis]